MLLSSWLGNSHEFFPISQISVTELLGHVSALQYGSKQTRNAVVEQTKEDRKTFSAFKKVDRIYIHTQKDLEGRCYKFEGYVSSEWDVCLPKTLRSSENTDM